MDEFLAIQDICQRYKISKWTLYQWTSKRLIPHIKINGKILFRETDLKKWEERHLHQPSVNLL